MIEANSTLKSGTLLSSDTLFAAPQKFLEGKNVFFFHTRGSYEPFYVELDLKLIIVVSSLLDC